MHAALVCVPPTSVHRAMISLTSWTGQESAEGAAMQGNALLHTKKKNRSKKFGDVQTPSGRMHIDLASDLIQVGCDRVGEEGVMLLMRGRQGV